MLDDAAPGGGGNGAIPTLFLSLAAAAAAAEAYLRPSPAGLEGTDAGFIAGVPELPLLIVDNGACNVASAGKGDFVWDDVLRTGSTSFCAFLASVFGKSVSVVRSSCTD